MYESTSSDSRGRLLALLVVCFYILFTLLVNSHSLMVAWPGVFCLQLGLFSPLIWLLWQVAGQKRLILLGNQLDLLILILIIALLISTLGAVFSQTAIWYSFMPLGYISSLYALHNRLAISQKPQKLLFFQGYLSLAFIIVSLVVWTTATLLPELGKINELASFQVALSFDFSLLEMQNWAPLGHQNYVAGYLILAIPLLLGLAGVEEKQRRWIWWTGVILGLVDLYTTQSRAGWLGILSGGIVGVLILLTRSRKQAYTVIPLLLGGLALLTVVSPRVVNIIQAIGRGDVVEKFAYRLINWQVGLSMFKEHPFFGVGLGNVPLLYQKHLPVWGGRESELAYQLHSTPAQLLAEMGIWGILLYLGAIAWLLYMGWRLLRQKLNLANPEFILVVAIYCAFLGYLVVSIFDYQLDNIAISGIIIIFTAYLSRILPPSKPPVIQIKQIKLLLSVYIAVLIAIVIWVLPVQRAWLHSHQGFTALTADKFPTFVSNLERSHQLVPWEAYYPYQLGWNIGDYALTNAREELIPEAQKWLQAGIDTLPYWEFGYSNLAWLSLNRQPQLATANFLEAAQLLPLKRGLFYGLGLSLLAQGQNQAAVEAITLEALRDPLFITSPMWRSPQIQPLYHQITQRLLNQYNLFLEQDPTHSQYWRQCRGSLYWWLGDFNLARQDWQKYGNSLSKKVLDLSLNPDKIEQLAPDSLPLIIQAWLQTQQRLPLLQQAWIEVTRSALTPELEIALLESMNQADSLHQWLTQTSPPWRYRRQRLGFNLVSRHLDGVAPVDFPTVIENVAVTQWFADLFPSPATAIWLEIRLQPLREELLNLLETKE